MHITVNKPLSAFDSERLQSLRTDKGGPRPCCRQPRNPNPENVHRARSVDDLGDLAAKDHLVMLIPGGGFELPGWPCSHGWPNMPISKKQGRMIYRFLIALTAIRR